MADRVLFRFWTITDYEEEERFLREQHRKGWSLRRYILPGVYIFDKCMPEMSYTDWILIRLRNGKSSSICSYTGITDGSISLM